MINLIFLHCKGISFIHIFEPKKKGSLRVLIYIRDANRSRSGGGGRGNLVTIAHRLPSSSVNFYAYENYKKLLLAIPAVQSLRENRSSLLFVHFVSVGLACITIASVTYPLDLVRTRLAAQTNVSYYSDICHALQTICKDEGVLGLYKGLGATLLAK